MHSVVMCNFATLCTILMQDGSVQMYNLQHKLNELEAYAVDSTYNLQHFKHRLMAELEHDFTKLRLESLAKVVVKNLQHVADAVKEAADANKNATACYVKAQEEAVQLARDANTEMEPCMHQYMMEVNVIRDEVAEATEECAKTKEAILKVFPKCVEKSADPDHFESCISKKIPDLEKAVHHMKNSLSTLRVDGAEAVEQINKRNEECMGKVSSTLNTNLKPVRERAAECIKFL